VVTRHCLSKKNWTPKWGVCPVLGVLLVVAPTVPAGGLMRRWAQGYLFCTVTHQRRAPEDLVLTREKAARTGCRDMFLSPQVIAAQSSGA
jgi:hypothetical protein